jgi:hypothetical protein
MARLGERLADAQAALVTLEEFAGRDRLSVIERDGAILRLVFTFEAIWKAAAALLEEQEGIAATSPKAAIRASRQASLLSDEDAEEAIRIADDRNLAVHMYRQELGAAVAERLAGHAVVLHRWLGALLQRAEIKTASQAYQLFGQAMAERRQIVCMYDGYRRELCPIILGHSRGEEKALTFQFDGASRSGLPEGGEWRCLLLSRVSDVKLRRGRWHGGNRHTQPQGCVEDVDLDVNPVSPYNPKRRLRQG